MVRILVSPDSFGGTLSAVEAAAAIADGWRDGLPGTEIAVLPLADGGPGFLDVLHEHAGGQLLGVAARDPLGNPVSAQICLGGGGTAYVEIAQAAGLHLIEPDTRRPMAASSYGAGQLIAAAVESRAERIVIGLGGSATTDGGLGMLSALGITALDATGTALPPGGGALADLDSLVGSPALGSATLVAATDVDNPLCGEHGAARVFGPQKGADPGQVEMLDAGLRRLGGLLERDLPGCPPAVADLPGAGAAGGIGAALLALGAARQSGFAVVAHACGLEREIEASDLVITGEGRFDGQSLRGKATAGVASLAMSHGVPCVVLAGQVAAESLQLAAAGVTAAYSVSEHAGSLDAALRDAPRLLRDLATTVARGW